jgi:hypothetical protein
MASFKVCMNCGAQHPLRTRLCAKGCGSWSREERRAGAKSYFRAPTEAEVQAREERAARANALIEKLLAEQEA